MDFEKYLKNGYTLIKEQPLVLILGGLVVQMLLILSLGIAAGPLLAGYQLLLIQCLRDKRQATINDPFSGLKRFSALFPYFFLLLLIFCGFLFLIIPGLLFATWWLYALPLMADRQLSLGEAMRASKQKVDQTGFFMHLVFFLMISVIPTMILSFLANFVPVLNLLQILLLPFQTACVAGLYLDQFGEGSADKHAQEDTRPAGPAGGGTEQPGDFPVFKPGT